MRKASWIDLILVFMGRLRQVRVEGNSMLPTLKDGDKILVKPGGYFDIGDIVLASHPYKKVLVIKRIANVSCDGTVSLTGDNPEESADSRTFGEIAVSDVIGKLVARIG